MSWAAENDKSFLQHRPKRVRETFDVRPQTKAALADLASARTVAEFELLLHARRTA